MANADNTTNPTAQPAPATDRERPTLPAGRRRLLALAGGATALATTAHAAATTDEPLEALWRERERVDQLHTTAAIAVGEATDKAHEAYPPRPKILYGKRHETGELFPLSLGHIEQWRRSSLAIGLGTTVHEKQMAAWNEWKAACAAVDVAHGVDRLDDEAEALGFKLDALNDQIIDMPPRTLRGVLVKLKLLAALEGYRADDGEQDTPAQLVLGLIGDTEAAK